MTARAAKRPPLSSNKANAGTPSSCCPGYGGLDREIRILTIASGEERRMPDWPDLVTPNDLAWSPDGSRIAVAGFRGGALGGPPAIWTIKPDGSDRRFVRQGYGFPAPTAITWQPR